MEQASAWVGMGSAGTPTLRNSLPRSDEGFSFCPNQFSFSHVVLRLEPASEPPGSLVKTQFLTQWVWVGPEHLHLWQVPGGAPGLVSLLCQPLTSRGAGGTFHLPFSQHRACSWSSFYGSESLAVNFCKWNHFFTLELYAKMSGLF